MDKYYVLPELVWALEKRQYLDRMSDIKTNSAPKDLCSPDAVGHFNKHSKQGLFNMGKWLSQGPPQLPRLHLITSTQSHYSLKRTKHSPRLNDVRWSVHQQRLRAAFCSAQLERCHLDRPCGWRGSLRILNCSLRLENGSDHCTGGQPRGGRPRIIARNL